MSTHRCRALVLIASFALPAGARAQENVPPAVLQIYREELKPGKSAEHERVEAGWPRAFATAKWPTNSLAAASLTGPNEAWFFIGFDSFAAWEKEQRDLEKNPVLMNEMARLSQVDGELLSNVRSIIATYRPDLSYRANVDIAKHRYFGITTFRVRPGHDEGFAQVAKLYRDTYQKSNWENHWATYQITSGMVTPTYMVFEPLKSLAEVDASMKREQEFMQAVGMEAGKAMQKAITDGIIFYETNYFAFSPKMSYMAKEFVDRDPDFWKPKAAAKKAANP